MNPLGAIGQQVGADLAELGKSVASGVVKAATEITKDTIETAITAPTGVVGGGDGKKMEQNKSNSDQQAIIKKQQARRQFQEVKSELAEYIQRKKQLDAQIAQEKQQEQQQTEQKKAYEKQKKESFLQKLMANLARGSHGETDRQKE